MARSRISTTVTQGFVLGSQNHGSTLTITSTGSVVPIAYNAAGVVGNEPGDRVVNHGKIQGAEAA